MIAQIKTVQRDFLHHDEPMPIEAFGRLVIDISGGNKKPLCKMTNVEKMLKAYGVTVRFNLMLKKGEIETPIKEFSAADSFNTGVAFIRELATINKMPVGEIDSIINMILDKNRYHPALDWINSKEWDGVCRKDDFFSSVLTPNYQEDIKKVYLNKWALSAVGMLHNQGHLSYEGVLVFYGTQSAGKSSWVRWLVGANKSFQKGGLTLDLTNKDSIVTATSCWIGELGELDATLKRSSMPELKGFITNEQDSVRLPYARSATDFPRKTVYVASINEEAFLADKSGNRRWWTLTVEKTILHKEFDHQQFWAQMMVEFLEHYSIDNDLPWFITEESEKEMRDTSNVNYEKEDPVTDALLSTFSKDDPVQILLTPSSVARMLNYGSSQQMVTKVAASLAKHFEKGGRRSHGKTYRLPIPKNNLPISTLMSDYTAIKINK